MVNQHENLSEHSFRHRVAQAWWRLIYNGYRLGEPSSEAGRLAGLINTILAIICLDGLVFTVLNGLVFDLPRLALVNFVIFALAAALWIAFHLSDRLRLTAWTLTGMMVVMVTVFVLNVEYRYYALYWLLVVPLISIAVLGVRTGLLIGAAHLSASVAWMLAKRTVWPQEAFSLESISNIFVGYLAFSVLVAYLEASRASAMQAVERDNRDLQKRSNTDHLTGVASRGAIEQHLHQSLQASVSAQREYSVALVDLDGFKAINDNYGHARGDEMLQAAAKVLSDETNAKVGRWGGDEFLLVSFLDSATLAAQLATANQALKAQFKVRDGEQGGFSLSAGLTDIKPDDAPNTVLARADLALYAAKRNGKGQVEFA